MPFGGNDWLDLVKEPALEPDIPICDPHHHFWDFRSQSIPYHRYLLQDLVEDIDSGHNVVSTVFVEARSMYKMNGPDHLKSVGEVEFVQGLAAASASGLYGPSRAAAGIVGHADLKMGDRVEEVLSQLKAASPNRFRGIRHNVTWSPAPEVENREDQGLLGDATFRSGARMLAKMGLTFDTMLFFPQLFELADFAQEIPELPIILNHAGGVNRVGFYANQEDEILSRWRKGITAVSSCPNIYLKLGGLGMPRWGFEWYKRDIPVGSEELVSSMAPFMHYCIEQFGPDRCMFESNFPPDKVSYSYNVMYNAFKKLTKDYSVTERALMFHDTATKVYKIEV